jgi:hypothetical protein
MKYLNWNTINDFSLGLKNGKIKSTKLPEHIKALFFRLEECYIPFEMVAEYNVQNRLPPLYAIVQLLPIFFECYEAIKKDINLGYNSEDRFIRKMKNPSYILTFLKQFRDILIPWWL